MPGSDFGPPPAQRAGRRLRLPRLRTLLILIIVAMVLGSFAVWALYSSNLLRVERVTVSGTRVLTEEQVRGAAEVPMGVPLASVDTGAVEHRLKTSLRRIASVEAVRDWPNSMGLKVTERTPEALMEKPGDTGKYIEVDVEGVPYATVAKRPKGVPLLVLDVDKSAGSRRFGADRLRLEAVKATVALPEAVRRDTRTVRIGSYDSITMELSGNRTVMWGSSEHGAAKARTLTALMKAEKEAGHFDVSVPSAPAASAS
ncbi:cell division protein FtsQ/DivIB [Streptomyces gobiensis]|uniref:cell division protein FtsQ/DivIB n=1 Tax=Streptomyces gobiensis TaxID=2875706 RepID=UPI001E3CFFA8|nr:FtsQ-type POTRA domain-containing protein [Streptomyces gobiensis]UGY94997.1 FtsQ-type POTRA domain-containing protein [Streptomyces gobiensis]